jgi:hypothetical protein
VSKQRGSRWEGEKKTADSCGSYRKGSFTLKQYKEEYIFVLRKSNFLYFPISMCGKFISS